MLETKTVFSWWVEKKYFIYTLEYYLTINKWTFDMHNTVNESQTHYTEWKKR